MSVLFLSPNIRIFCACTAVVLDEQNIPASESSWADMVLCCKYAFWQISEPVVKSVSCPLSELDTSGNQCICLELFCILLVIIFEIKHSCITSYCYAAIATFQT